MQYFESDKRLSRHELREAYQRLLSRPEPHFEGEDAAAAAPAVPVAAAPLTPVAAAHAGSRGTRKRAPAALPFGRAARTEQEARP